MMNNQSSKSIAKIVYKDVNQQKDDCLACFNDVGSKLKLFLQEDVDCERRDTS